MTLAGLGAGGARRSDHVGFSGTGAGSVSRGITTARARAALPTDFARWGRGDHLGSTLLSLPRDCSPWLWDEKLQRDGAAATSLRRRRGGRPDDSKDGQARRAESSQAAPTAPSAMTDRQLAGSRGVWEGASSPCGPPECDGSARRRRRDPVHCTPRLMEHDNKFTEGKEFCIRLRRPRRVRLHTVFTVSTYYHPSAFYITHAHAGVESPWLTSLLRRGVGNENHHASAHFPPVAGAWALFAAPRRGGPSGRGDPQQRLRDSSALVSVVFSRSWTNGFDEYTMQGGEINYSRLVPVGRQPMNGKGPCDSAYDAYMKKADLDRKAASAPRP